MFDEATEQMTNPLSPHARGMLCGPSCNWLFIYDPQQEVDVSSTRKRVYKGVFVASETKRPLAARALAFNPEHVAAFGIECANLGQFSDLGVGPKLLGIANHQFSSACVSPTIIEEDCGETLADLLYTDASECDRPILHSLGTRERQIENQKILYDVFVQVANAHKANVYHRDLRCENVCVRRFGPAPANIRATVIDFELSSTIIGGAPRAQASLYNTLFAEVPSFLAHRPITLTPNPLELDMGYLAALQYHLDLGYTVLNGTRHSAAELSAFVHFLDSKVSYFAYRPDGTPPLARHLNKSIDIKPLAKRLGLATVTRSTFASKQLLAFAKTLHKPYLDAEEMETCMQSPEAKLAQLTERIAIAIFEEYKRERQEQGMDVPYARFEDQPLDLQLSNYDQAEHIPHKVRALGYILVPQEQTEGQQTIEQLNEKQIETLACMEHDRWINERVGAGWVLDKDAPKSDSRTKTSPYLVPYDQLTDDMKEFDRNSARQLVSLVKEAGLAIIRP